MSNNDEAPAGLSKLKLILLMLAAAVTVANSYYIHPLVDPISRHFGVSEAEIGFAPALTQLALAAGIFLLLPLGDRMSKQRLVLMCISAQFLGILAMAMAPSYPIFLAASALLGFATIAPYVLPAYVSRLVPRAKLGEVNAALATGVMLGILAARSGGGIVGEYFGWRAVYYMAAILMLIAAIVVPRIMRDDPKTDNEDGASPAPQSSYFALLGSMFPIAFARPAMLLSALIQALSFGIFFVIWLAVGLHLPGELGYGVDIVGYLALVAIINLITTVPLGRWADKIGAEKARLYIALLQLASLCVMPFVGYNLWLMLPALIVSNITYPIIDVAGRMTFLSEPDEIRTRLMTVYVVIMFVGGGIFSWAATAAYGWGGWHATSMLAISVSAVAVLLSIVTWRAKGR